MLPLLTFALVAYNQQQFIGAAIDGAFNQTYSPLEIILSDDCSSDETFEVMKVMAASYHGPHRVVLNRNESNTGLAEHVNKLVRMAGGELIVAAAGDDISLPDRTAAVYHAWETTGRNAMLIHSRVTHIDERGEQFRHSNWHNSAPVTGHIADQTVTPEAYVISLVPEVFGAAGAWQPSLFKVFGGLPKHVTHDDNVTVLRALILGRVIYIDTPLVKYRLHENNMCNSSRPFAANLDSIREAERLLARSFSRKASMYRAFAQDLENAYRINLLSDRVYVAAMAVVRRNQLIYFLEHRYMQGNFAQRASILLRLASLGLAASDLWKFVIRFPSRSLFHGLKLCTTKLRCSLRGVACGLLRHK